MAPSASTLRMAKTQTTGSLRPVGCGVGHVAVAVDPTDERYAHLHGKTLLLPLVNREIPVIADEYVDKAFDMLGF